MLLYKKRHFTVLLKILRRFNDLNGLLIMTRQILRHTTIRMMDQRSIINSSLLRLLLIMQVDRILLRIILRLHLRHLRLQLHVLMMTLRTHRLLRILRVLLTRLIMLRAALCSVDTRLIMIFIQRLRLQQLDRHTILHRMLGLMIRRRINDINRLRMMNSIQRQIKRRLSIKFSTSTITRSTTHHHTGLVHRQIYRVLTHRSLLHVLMLTQLSTTTQQCMMFHNDRLRLTIMK